MPQLNPEFFVSQLFWLAVFFTFLFVFLWRVSLPRIATVLEKRQNKIDENLSSAKELQEQAMEIEKKINDRINKAKLETDEKIKETINALQEDVSSQLSSLDKDLEKTYEDNTLVSKKQRAEHFGQYDHVRVYGKDYKNRLEDSGFNVNLIDYTNEIEDDEISKYGLIKGELIPIVKKSIG